MIPVVLFVYKRTNTLAHTLACLKANHVKQLIIFSDAPKTESDVEGVRAVREMVSAIDWCEKEIVLRENNVGLGRNIKDGLGTVFEHYEAAIVCEDDLEFVEGTIDYLTAALEHYSDDVRVMSVTGFTNKHITPGGVGDLPYFDGRFECMLWGTWRRVWNHFSAHTARELMEMAKSQGENPYFWGGDLPYMAKVEIASNIWAVRMCYLHIYEHGLVLRPPWSMVNHIGWGNGATNACTKNWEYNGKLRSAPPLPEAWPNPVLNPMCAALHRKMYKRPWIDVFPTVVPIARRFLRSVGIKV